ncbi:MAG: hypothetical protein R3F16_06980 [Myxococcota bacterium]
MTLLENDGTGVFTPVVVCGVSKLPREPRMLVARDFEPAEGGDDAPMKGDAGGPGRSEPT